MVAPEGNHQNERPGVVPAAGGPVPAEPPGSLSVSLGLDVSRLGPAMQQATEALVDFYAAYLTHTFDGITNAVQSLDMFTEPICDGCDAPAIHRWQQLSSRGYYALTCGAPECTQLEDCRTAGTIMVPTIIEP